MRSELAELHVCRVGGRGGVWYYGQQCVVIVRPSVLLNLDVVV